MNNTQHTRRSFLISSLALMASAAIPMRHALAGTGQTDASWDSFIQNMTSLADKSGHISSEQVVAQGLQYLESLDITGQSFSNAVDAAYESGNEFWLWQRMVKQNNINGGILHIDSSRLVQLHDHPGATGILRIISGETEVWQYDRASTSANGNEAQLQLVSRRVLLPGDTAALSPVSGNIHALRSISPECSMLDFFIPPYKQNQRTWYAPLDKNWQESELITCQCISQQDKNIS